MITVGILTPHAAAGAEVEFWDLAGDGLRTRIARITSSSDDGDATPPTTPSGLRALTRPSVVDEAVARLEPETLDAIAYASTSTAYVIGYEAEREFVGRLRKRWSVPVCSTPASVVDVLRRSDVRRLSLVHPPWFGHDRNAWGAAYFRDQGFTVVQAELAGVAEDPELVEPDDIVDWVSSHIHGDAEAVFLGGNGFRAARAVPELEKRLGCLVVESNQVLLGSVLSEIGATASTAEPTTRRG
jgi:maleate isomerase